MSRTLFLLLVAVCFLLALFLARQSDDLRAADESSPAKTLVAKALAAEPLGQQAERQKLLEQALAVDPDFGPARWHSGFVRRDGRWMTIEQAQQAAADDDRLTRYWALANSATLKTKDQLRLARWCDEQGLEDLAKMHWFRVHLQKPRDREAARQLGMQEFEGRYFFPEQAEALQRYQAASKHWQPLLASWKRAIEDGGDEQREEARQSLRAVQDVAAIPFLVDQYGDDSHLAKEVVTVLGGMPPLETCGWLCLLAVNHQDEPVRSAAVRQLISQIGRCPQIRYEVIPSLLGQLRLPTEFSYYLSTINCVTYTISEFGPTANYQTTVANPTIVRLLPGATSNPKLRKLDHQRSLQFLAQVARAGHAVERRNEAARDHNERVFAVLQAVADKKLPDDPQRWWDWWLKENERVVDEYKPTFYKDVGNLVVTQSCFLAGTPVWTETGPKPIEQVKVGERVLSQDPETGELSYCFVLDATVRPPSKMLRVHIGHDEIWSTRGHLFWVSGKGWRMAKQLEVGDQIHSVRGVYPVTAVKDGPSAEAHNLVVDRFHTYFVGEMPLLVHDNMPRRLTPTIVPGLVQSSGPE